VPPHTIFSNLNLFNLKNLLGIFSHVLQKVLYSDRNSLKVASQNVKTFKEILSVVGGMLTTHKIPWVFLKMKCPHLQGFHFPK
jgi:hypothetical protein